VEERQGIGTDGAFIRLEESDPFVPISFNHCPFLITTLHHGPYELLHSAEKPESEKVEEGKRESSSRKKMRDP